MLGKRNKIEGNLRNIEKIFFCLLIEENWKFIVRDVWKEFEDLYGINIQNNLEKDWNIKKGFYDRRSYFML